MSCVVGVLTFHVLWANRLIDQTFHIIEFLALLVREVHGQLNSFEVIPAVLDTQVSLFFSEYFDLNA